MEIAVLALLALLGVGGVVFISRRKQPRHDGPEDQEPTPIRETRLTYQGEPITYDGEYLYLSEDSQ